MKDPSDLERVSSSVHRLTSFLTGENVGHNVFVTRGSAFDPAASSSAVAADCLRVFVWARETLVGAKDAGEERRKRQQQQQQRQ